MERIRSMVERPPARDSSCNSINFRQVIERALREKGTDQVKNGKNPLGKTKIFETLRVYIPDQGMGNFFVEGRLGDGGLG